MAVEFVGAGELRFVEGSQDLDLPVPGGASQGDWLVAVVIFDDASSLVFPGAFDSVESTGGPIRLSTYVREVGASEPSEYTWTVNGDGRAVGVILAYSGTVGVDVNSEGTGTSTSCTSPSVTTTDANRRVLSVHAARNSGGVQALSTPDGTTSRAAGGNNDPTMALRVADFLKQTGGATTARTATVDPSSDWAAQQIALEPSNVAPNAPAQTSPVGGATIDRTTVERFGWNFDDDDTDDSQSAFDLQIREQGTTSLDVDVSEETTVEHWDLDGGTLAAGDYEWRVRTYDALGAQGSWSGWEPFTAADPPAGPSITDPTSGGTIPTETYTVAWSASEQDDYQLRRVADDGGSPDTTTVYFDTGTVSSSSARALAVDFPVNQRWEHVQLRVRRDGLWSDWASVRVEVDYTEPATPTLTVVEDAPSGAISILVDNPAPSGSQPSVDSNDLWRRLVDDGGDGIRIATGVPADGDHVDWAVASGTGYAYRARALGDNGVTAWSAWTEEPAAESGFYGGGYE